MYAHAYANVLKEQREIGGGDVETIEASFYFGKQQHLEGGLKLWRESGPCSFSSQ